VPKKRGGDVGPELWPPIDYVRGRAPEAPAVARHHQPPRQGLEARLPEADRGSGRCPPTSGAILNLEGAYGQAASSLRACPENALLGKPARSSKLSLGSECGSNIRSFCR
jgi:hypothetical protein